MKTIEQQNKFVDLRRLELEKEITSATVVFFTSSIIDTRSLEVRLEHLEIPYKQIVLSMSSPAMRDKFNYLRSMTQWPYLPQIFFEGDFIGGVEEFMSFPGIGLNTQVLH